jgi:hypothetical protein
MDHHLEFTRTTFDYARAPVTDYLFPSAHGRAPPRYPFIEAGSAR